MKTIVYIVVALIVLVGSVAPDISFAQTSNLEQRLADLEQQLAILKRQIEVKKEEDAKKVAETSMITVNAKDGVSIKSPDDNFKFKIGGYVQVDSRIFTNNKKDASGGTSTFLARRVRPIISGTVAHDFNYYLMPELTASTSSAPILVDAYGEYAKFPGFKLRAGKFKAPFSLENLQNSQYNNFAELGLPSNLYPSRDIGVQLSGGFVNDAISYGVGYFNGQNDRESSNSATGNMDTNNDKAVVGRIFVQPFKNASNALLAGLGFGYAGSYEHQEASTLPTFISPGQSTVFTYGGGAVSNIQSNGPRIRTSPQAYYYYKSVGVLGEYVDSAQQLSGIRAGVIHKDTFHNKAWQVSGTYILTGEDASYAGVKPRHPLGVDGGLGAFELAGRYGALNIDHNIFNEGFAANGNTNITGEKAWGLGLNWYLNNNVKAVLDFEQTKFNGGAASNINNGNRKPENVVTTRLQVSF